MAPKVLRCKQQAPLLRLQEERLVVVKCDRSSRDRDAGVSGVDHWSCRPRIADHECTNQPVRVT